MNVIKLFEFEENNKNYLVYIENNTLSFGYYIDDVISNDLTIDEIKSIKEIYIINDNNRFISNKVK